MMNKVENFKEKQKYLIKYVFSVFDATCLRETLEMKRSDDPRERTIPGGSDGIEFA